MRQPELLPIAESLAGLIPRLARGLASPEKDLVDELSLAQLRLCGMLIEGPCAMSALSRELGVSQSALTQIADRLERARIVKRVAAGDDRRVRCLQLASRGETMMRKRRDARLRRSMAVLGYLTSIQREQVMSAMETLVAACTLMQEGAPASPRKAARRKAANGHVSNGNGHSESGHSEKGRGESGPSENDNKANGQGQSKSRSRRAIASAPNSKLKTRTSP